MWDGCKLHTSTLADFEVYIWEAFPCVLGSNLCQWPSNPTPTAAERSELTGRIDTAARISTGTEPPVPVQEQSRLYQEGNGAGRLRRPREGNKVLLPKVTLAELPTVAPIQCQAWNPEEHRSCSQSLWTTLGWSHFIEGTEITFIKFSQWGESQWACGGVWRLELRDSPERIRLTAKPIDSNFMQF